VVCAKQILEGDRRRGYGKLNECDSSNSGIEDNCGSASVGIVFVGSLVLTKRAKVVRRLFDWVAFGTRG